MEPNMDITIRLSGFAADSPHDQVVDIFVQTVAAARVVADANELELFASWNPRADER